MNSSNNFFPKDHQVAAYTNSLSSGCGYLLGGISNQPTAQNVDLTQNDELTQETGWI